MKVTYTPNRKIFPSSYLMFDGVKLRDGINILDDSVKDISLFKQLVDLGILTVMEEKTETTKTASPKTTTRKKTRTTKTNDNN